MTIIGADRLFAPASDFDSPVGILTACHERIEQRLRTLARLCGWLPGHGADAQARSAAESILRYFAEAAPRHHEDEDLDLMPALLAAPLDAATRAQVQALVARVQADHHDFPELWEPVEPVLRAVAAGDDAARLDAAAVDALCERYRAHIRLEEDELYPVAARALEADALRALARSMQARRGLAGPSEAGSGPG